MVVLLGIDVHKATHTAVAVDEVGQKIGQCVVAATDGGHRQLLGWALSRWSGDRLRFAVEDCRQVSTRLERTLLGAGQTVVRVPPKLTAGSLSAARTRGKSDPIDALAIARAALREPDLPVATLDGQFREVRLLVDHREDLVAVRTQMQNRLRWHLHELEPGREPGLRCLDRYCALDLLAAWLTGCAELGGDHAQTSPPGHRLTGATRVPDSLGGWRDPSNVRRVWRRVCDHAGIDCLVRHTLRKTVASFLDDAAVSTRKISDQLGHSRVSMTQDRYLGRKLTDRQTAEVLEKLLGSGEA